MLVPVVVEISGLSLLPSDALPEIFLSDPIDLSLRKLNQFPLELGVTAEFNPAAETLEHVVVAGRIIVVNRDGMLAGSAFEGDLI